MTRRKRNLPRSEHHVTARPYCPKRATLPTSQRRNHLRRICRHPTSLTDQATTEVVFAVFTSGLARCVKSKAHLTLKLNAKLVFLKASPVPYFALPRTSQKVDRLVAASVLSFVDHSDCAAPFVVLQKKNGPFRLCADYSTELNDALEQHQHPLPTPDAYS
ncbi:hypothetical protein Aduo_008377 [Ancylostoma duodenale]